MSEATRFLEALPLSKLPIIENRNPAGDHHPPLKDRVWHLPSIRREMRKERSALGIRSKA
jgi:hypothetical protein